MDRQRRDYLRHVVELDGDVEGRERALSFIRASDIWAYGEPVPFSYVPYLYDADDLAFLRKTTDTVYEILCKVIRRYLQDPSYREVFGFSPELERLILLPCGYDELIPMARFDLFLNERDRSFKFCEFNTDGTSAMSRSHMIAQALMGTRSFRRYAARHKVVPFELFDSWVNAFLGVYRSDAHAVESPTVAIVDFSESIMASDVGRFVEAFARAGVPARFVDVRALAFDGRHLRDAADGTVIHAVYRRAVTSEILRHVGECDALIDAVAAEAVCLVGHFRTNVVHSKMVSVALFHEPTRRQFLSDEECAFIDAHLPRTARLVGDGSVDIGAVLAHKDAWILKPEDDYGGHGVIPGQDCTQGEWERAVDRCTDAGYIVQEFCLPPTVDVVAADVDARTPCKVEALRSMPGLYAYAGTFAGVYNRLGRGGVIAVGHDSLCACGFMVDCEAL